MYHASLEAAFVAPLYVSLINRPSAFGWPHPPICQSVTRNPVPSGSTDTPSGRRFGPSRIGSYLTILYVPPSRSTTTRAKWPLPHSQWNRLPRNSAGRASSLYPTAPVGEPPP